MGRGIAKRADGSLGTAAELRRRLLEQGLLWEEPRERSVVIENSLDDPEMLRRSWKLLQLPID